VSSFTPPCSEVGVLFVFWKKCFDKLKSVSIVYKLLLILILKRCETFLVYQNRCSPVEASGARGLDSQRQCANLWNKTQIEEEDSMMTDRWKECFKMEVTKMEWGLYTCKNHSDIQITILKWGIFYEIVNNHLYKPIYINIESINMTLNLT
jgi:hypothetical protein